MFQHAMTLKFMQGVIEKFTKIFFFLHSHRTVVPALVWRSEARMHTLALRTTTSKGFTFHGIQPSFVLRQVPAAPAACWRSFWLRIGWVARPFFLQEFTRY